MDMKTKPWKAYVFWIVLAEAAGVLSALLTRSGMALYNATAVKPALSPPDAAFPIVWAVLFALMGIGAARAALTPVSRQRRRSLGLFLVQLAFNFCWSLLFFRLFAFGAAFIWLVALWVLILLMLLAFRRLDKAAGLLQLPYLLWVTFAGYLNLMAWLLNR